MQRMRAALVCFAVIGCSSGAGKPSETRPATPPATADDFVLVGLPEGLTEGVMASMKYVASVERYKLGQAQGVFQTLDVPKDQPAGLHVFVVDGPPARLPDLCMLRKEVVRVCTDATCSDIDGTAHPVILCSARSLRTLDALFRIEHAHEVWAERNGSDVAFTQMIKAAAADPDKLLDEVKPNVTEKHLSDHWGIFSAVALLHAMEHWLDTSGQTVFDGPETAGALTAETCGSYAALPKPGTGSWAAEVKADERATELTVELIALLGKNDPTFGANVEEELVGDLGLAARWMWYRGVDGFLTKSCPAVVGQRFAMSRCLCTSRDNWKLAAEHVLPPTRPPFLLRAVNVMMRVIQHRTTAPSQRIVAEFMFIERFHDAAIKLAAASCDPNVVTASLPLQLPALEGEKVMSESVPLLWPSVKDREQLSEFCARPR